MTFLISVRKDQKDFAFLTILPGTKENCSLGTFEGGLDFSKLF